MLWQGDTIVVFYERFGSAYSDTRLGKIRETEKLKATVDKGEVEVRFAAE